MVAKRFQSAPLTKTSGDGNPGSTVTIHETANTTPGADAGAHANMQTRGNVRNASWHWSVDDTEAVQSFGHEIQCWHAGTAKGNNTSIAIEICVNSDGNYVQAVENAAQLAADILVEKGHGIGALRQHEDWTGKNCPTNLLSGAKGPTWNGFVERVNQLLSGTAPTPTPEPTPPPASGLVVDGLWGRATSTRLQQVFGTVADGEIWGQYRPNAQPAFVDGWVYNYPSPKGSPVIRAFQAAIGAGADGVWGKNSTLALQHRYGLVADGELWAPSPAVAELQRRLNAGTV